MVGVGGGIGLNQANAARGDLREHILVAPDREHVIVDGAQDGELQHIAARGPKALNDLTVVVSPGAA